jgi:adenosine deaminase
MARRGVLVEICLTSNDSILGVRGRDHPLPAYIAAGVPVALATDDEGVSRSELTWEFERAVETYHLDYATLKRMVRDSLDHSFLAGSSLWVTPVRPRTGAASENRSYPLARPAAPQPSTREQPLRQRVTMVAACAGEVLRPEPTSPACRRFLDSSERARIEWKEEVEFSRFEAGF